MSGDICGRHNSGSREVAFGTQWVEAMGAGKHLKMHRMSPPPQKQNYLLCSVNSAEVEEPSKC